MENTIKEFSTYVYDTDTYNLTEKQRRLVFIAAGFADRLTRSNPEALWANITAPDNNGDIDEFANHLAEELFDVLEACHPTLSDEDIIESLKFGAYLGYNDPELDLEDRAGYYLGEHYPAQEAVARTDYITSAIEDAKNVTISSDYSFTDWSAYYLGALAVLDDHLNTPVPKFPPRGFKKALRVVDDAIYDIHKEYRIDYFNN